MKRLTGGWDPDEGNDPDRHSEPLRRTKEVPVTPVMKQLHPFTRAVIGLASTAGSIWSLFTWDWRYFAAGCFIVAGGLIVGPWVWPHERVRLDPKPLESGDEIGNPW